MANKPIIDIDINDAQFRDFYKLFQEYQGMLEDMPDSWKKMNEIGQKLSITMQKIDGKQVAGGFHEAMLAVKQFHQEVRRSVSEMNKLVNKAGALGSHIFGIGKFLMKFGALGAGFGIGGLFGLRELGESAVQGQRSARGIGITQGQLRAFRADFGRYVDPGILASIANAQNSFQGRVNLGIATGIGYQGIAGAATDKLAIQAMLRAHDVWNRLSPSQRVQENPYIQSFLKSGFSLEDLRRLGATSRSDILAGQFQYQKDKNLFGVANQNVSAWYKLTRELNIAGQTIETALIRKLSTLSPVISTFVNSLTKDTIALLTGALTPENLNKIAGAIKEFATYLGSGDLQKQFHDLGAAVSSVVDIINTLTGNKRVDHPQGVFQQLFGWRTEKWEKERAAEAKYHQTAAQRLAGLESQYHLPAGILGGIYQAESSSGKDPRIWYPNKAGALGPFQFREPTGKRYGLSSSDRLDFNKSSDAAARYIRDLLKEYSIRDQAPINSARVIQDALKAYNGSSAAGPTSYTSKIMRGLKPQVNVTVSNKSGNNVAVSVNGAAY